MMCANPDCKRTFPRRGNKKFCSPECRERYHGGRQVKSKHLPYPRRRIRQLPTLSIAPAGPKYRLFTQKTTVWNTNLILRLLRKPVKSCFKGALCILHKGKIYCYEIACFIQNSIKCTRDPLCAFVFEVHLYTCCQNNFVLQHQCLNNSSQRNWSTSAAEFFTAPAYDPGGSNAHPCFSEQRRPLRSSFLYPAGGYL